MIRHATSLLLLLAALASPVAAADLRLSPALCAVGEGEKLCNISIKVRFEPDDNRRYCLSIADKGLVRCFAGNSARELQVYVSADSDLHFRVTEGESGAHVASATLKVAHFRPKRHKRRYDWGLL